MVCERGQKAGTIATAAPLSTVPHGLCRLHGVSPADFRQKAEQKFSQMSQGDPVVAPEAANSQSLKFRNCRKTESLLPRDEVLSPGNFRCFPPGPSSGQTVAIAAS